MEPDEPLHGRAGATWLVLHDPVANRVSLIKMQELGTWIRNVMSAPQPGWLMAVRHEPEFFHVLIHLDWASSAQLSRLAVKLKKGEYLEWRDLKLMTKEDFVHPHNHSMFSLLDGASTIEGIAERALLNGRPGIALTDHAYMFGTFKHWKTCMETGIKPLMGASKPTLWTISHRSMSPRRGRPGGGNTTRP